MLVYSWLFSPGALLLLDPEEPTLPEEVTKLRADINRRGLGLAVAADWFNPELMATLDYTDDAGNRCAHHSQCIERDIKICINR